MKKILILLLALVMCVSMVSSSVPYEMEGLGKVAIVEHYKTCKLTGQGGYSVNGYYVLNDCRITKSYELAKLDAKGVLYGY